MSAEKAIFGMLKSNAALLLVIPTARINPSLIPLGMALPAIAYSLVSRVEETAISLKTMIVRSRMQITIAVSGVTPSSYSAAKEISKLVKDACNNKRGVFNTVDVKSSILAFEGADYRDDESGITYSTIDFRVVTLE